MYWVDKPKSIIHRFENSFSIHKNAKITLGPEHDIFWLQISVNDPEVMQVADSLKNGLHDLASVFIRKTPSGPFRRSFTRFSKSIDVFLQVTPFTQLDWTN